MQPIDYQVGDIVVPSDPRVKQELCIVKDITEKGALISFIDFPEHPFFVQNAELHKLKKHKIGSMLYGRKG